MTMTGEGTIQRPARRYLRAPAPKHFPVDQDLPETPRHSNLRVGLYDAVLRAFADWAQIGSSQFIYWDPTDPAQRCAPDLFVRIGKPDTEFECWKTWEHGAPQLAVAIVTDGDDRERPWETNLARCARIGIAEFVRFDADDAAQPVRIWDRIEGDLVERDPQGPGFSRCDTLDAFWCVHRDPSTGLDLRLSRDEQGSAPFLTAQEGRTSRQR
jgi:hypothetical protein